MGLKVCRMRDVRIPWSGVDWRATLWQRLACSPRSHCLPSSVACHNPAIVLGCQRPRRYDCQVL